MLEILHWNIGNIGLKLSSNIKIYTFLEGVSTILGIVVGTAKIKFGGIVKLWKWFWPEHSAFLTYNHT